MNLKLPAAASDTSPKSDDLPFTPATQLAKVAFGLVLLTFLIYLPVIGYTFVNYDDDVFVTNNKMVAPGFTWAGIKWAFTSTEIDYWRPLSWLSHMLDMELFGAVGGLHHLTNVLIHAAAAVMLLVALHRLTKVLWPSALVAALFAWHPLHVESVAWIAERKDVLCGFFWFFTIWAYARYVERPGVGAYVLVFMGFVLGVMSKPMIVTLPCALLLLDFWPLRRVTITPLLEAAGRRAELVRLRNVVVEKVPLFGIVVILCVSTFAAQREVGTMGDQIPLFARLATASVGYVTYLGQTIWPANLCVLYPLIAESAPWKWAGAALLLVVLSTRCLMLGRHHPYLFVGWFWFLGILVPVIGLVQVGEQSHADRYTYVPLVGLFIVCVWSVVSQFQRHPGWRRWSVWGALTILMTYAGLTRMQLRHWEDSVHVFQRVVEVNPRAITAYNNLSAELMVVGKYKQSAEYIQRALAIEPRLSLYFNLSGVRFLAGDYPQATVALNQALNMMGKNDFNQVDQWLEQFRTVQVPDEKQAPLHKLLATVRAARKDYVGAIADLQETLRRTPQDVNARIDLAAYQAAIGQDVEALRGLEQAVRLSPTNEIALSNLGGLLARSGRLEEAFLQYQAALKINPGNLDTRYNFALALARSNRAVQATAELEEVLRSNPDYLPALNQLTWLLATRSDCRNASRAYVLAKRLLVKVPTALSYDTAAAAAAANGQFDEAIQLATRGVQMAQDAKFTVQEDGLRARLKLYQQRQSFTQ